LYNIIKRFDCTQSSSEYPENNTSKDDETMTSQQSNKIFKLLLINYC